MPQAARLHEIAEVPEGSPAPAAASAPWTFATLVVGTSLDSRAPCRRPYQDAGELLPWFANHRHCNLVRDAHSWDLKVRY